MCASVCEAVLAVLEIRIRNWSAIFLKIGYFIGYYVFAVPLKTYRKYGWPKWIVVGQMLKLLGKWPTVISSTVLVDEQYMYNLH